MILKKTGPKWSGTPKETGRFLKIVTKIKVELTDAEEFLAIFTIDGQDRFTRIFREEFEGCTEHLLKMALDVVEKALDDCADRIVLVGGSSNMPQIPRAIVERTGYDSKDLLMYEPSKAIAKGATVYAKLTSPRWF